MIEGLEERLLGVRRYSPGFLLDPFLASCVTQLSKTLFLSIDSMSTKICSSLDVYLQQNVNK